MKENGNERKPYKISLNEKECLSSSTFSLVQKRCHGNRKCLFQVQKNEFLSTPSKCSTTPSLLVYYTCTTLEKGMEIFSVLCKINDSDSKRKKYQQKYTCFSVCIFDFTRLVLASFFACLLLERKGTFNKQLNV